METLEGRIVDDKRLENFLENDAVAAHTNLTIVKNPVKKCNSTAQPSLVCRIHI